MGNSFQGSTNMADRRTDPWSDYVLSMARMIDSKTFFNGHLYDYIPERRGVPSSSIPVYPRINNLNSLLHDMYLRYIAINDADFETYYNIVHDIFFQMHKMMKNVDEYYGKYSSAVQFVGSHPDRLRINKPDEFDIDIVMNMPLRFSSHPCDPQESDFLLHPSEPGYMQLKMGKQYQFLPKKNDWGINSRVSRWKDDKDYFLRSKFLDWFKSVVTRALNQFKGWDGTPTFYVAGAPYTVRRSESGPAMTLYIENKRSGIKLDIDLVLGLRFPIDRWPNDGRYRKIPAACVQNDQTTYWMLVPKLNKAGASEQDMARSWRIAMHEQERMLMHDTNNLRQAIRLMKKFRDAQFMDKLSSYYIKTIFFWEVARREHDKSFWNKSPAILFTYMLKILYVHLRQGNIPFFWNPSNNLIADVDKTTLIRYIRIVGELVKILDKPSRYMEVTKYLLDKYEYEEYNQLLRIPPKMSFFIAFKDFITRMCKFLFFCLFVIIIISIFGE